MITSLILASSFWPAEVIQQCAPSSEAIIVAIAENAKHEHLYCEIFTQHDKKVHANYTFNSTVIATKELDYTISLNNPQVKQKDLRTGERREATINEKDITLLYQEKSTSKTEKETFPLMESDATDAGFNNFIITHWDELLAGKTVPLDFASISHQRLLPLKISLKSADKCALKKAAAAAPICFWVDIDNAFLRLLIGNIKLSYDDERRLIQYDGIVNINDSKGKTQHAVIHYYYANNNNQYK